MNALIRPRTIAVIGASPKRQTLGNVALDNLANYKFAGRVIPVHAEAPEIAGLAAVPAIEALPDGVDVALASVPAAGVADVVRRLERRGVRTAIVNTAGFSAEQEAELRRLVNSSRILMHGPNCMGLINLSDATPIYTGGITSRIRKGPVALRWRAPRPTRRSRALRHGRGSPGRRICSSRDCRARHCPASGDWARRR